MSGRGHRILVEVSPGETRIATIDPQGQLLDFQIERINQPSLLGAIYRGRVTRVNASLGGGFVDLGKGEDGFLRQSKGLHEGQAITVQVIRDATESKGPSLTSRVALTGRYISWTPCRPGVHYSGRLGGGRRRAELEALADGLVAEGEGIAIRAAAAGAEDAAIAAECSRIRQEWSDLERMADQGKTPSLLLPAPDAVAKALRDGETGTVIFDDRGVYRDAAASVAESMPDRRDSLRYHGDAEPLFEAYGVADAVEELGARTVTMPNGPRLTIDSTEAMTVIDVDSAAADRRRAEDASLNTNLTALGEIARQIRLRNIAGLIVVDLISLRRKGSKTRILQAARKVFRSDPQQVDVLSITTAGLLEITRRRRGSPLASFLSRRTEERQSPEAAACAILRQAVRCRGGEFPELRATADIIDALNGPLLPGLQQLNRQLGRDMQVDQIPGNGDWELVMRTGKMQ